VQTVLIIALLVQNRRHNRAKADVQRQYAEITHAARLALIGEITASVAHEVTQPLSAILSNVETAELLLSQPTPNIGMVREILKDVRQDDLRADSIVRRLRTLLRKRELQLEDVDVNALTSSVLALILPDAVRRNILIRTALDPALPRASADPVHLQQVLLNLVINAMDSMKATPLEHRVLEIRTERSPGAHLTVTVLDKGEGFEPAKRDKLFDSFYTTKNESGQAVRFVLHDQERGPGPGPVDCTLDRAAARRRHLGGEPSRRRRGLRLHPALQGPVSDHMPGAVRATRATDCRNVLRHV